MNLITLKSNARFYALAFALIAPFTLSSVSFAAEAQEAEVLETIKEFIDIKRNPQRNFEHYATQLATQLKANPKFAELSKALYAIKSSKKQSEIAKALQKFKTDPNIPASIKAELNKISTIQMINVMRTRLK
ncbi:hypothetical protein H0X48_05160 [Candidatus Dependentiae bacterium]|nr:hypothetical protein [Candidatus Dependentiae bacterium]